MAAKARLELGEHLNAWIRRMHIREPDAPWQADGAGPVMADGRFIDSSRGRGGLVVNDHQYNQI